MSVEKDPSFETFPTLECSAFTLNCLAASEGFYNLSAVVMDKHSFKTTTLPFFITFKDHIPSSPASHGDEAYIPLYGKAMDHRLANTNERLLSRVKDAVITMIDKELNKVVSDDTGARSAERYTTLDVTFFGVGDISVAEYYLKPVEVSERAAIEVFSKERTSGGRCLARYDFESCPLNTMKDCGPRPSHQHDVTKILPALLKKVAAQQGHRLHREESGFEVQTPWGNFIIVLEDNEWCVYIKTHH